MSDKTCSQGHVISRFWCIESKNVSVDEAGEEVGQLRREDERTAETLRRRSIQKERHILRWIDCYKILEMENEELFGDDFCGNL